MVQRPNPYAKVDGAGFSYPGISVGSGRLSQISRLILIISTTQLTQIVGRRTSVRSKSVKMIDDDRNTKISTQHPLK